MTAFSRLIGATALTIALVGSANAGPVKDFETSMRGAYADYRGALFQTNANQPEAAAKAVDAFRQKWAALGQAKADTSSGVAGSYDGGEPIHGGTRVARVNSRADSRSTQTASALRIDHESRNCVLTSFRGQLSPYP